MDETQPHTPSVPPPPQVRGSVQTPQSSMLPQSSVKVPQESPAVAHEVAGWHTQLLSMQPNPGPQSLSEQHWPGDRQTPSHTSWPVGQQSSSPKQVP